jgi:hypothetical protein
VAHTLSRRPRQTGQVLVFFALVLPVIVLPVAAYAIDAAVTGAAYARLVEVTTLAAEEAAQQVDVPALRAGGTPAIAAPEAAAAVRDAIASDKAVRITGVAVSGATVIVSTVETVSLPLAFVGSGAVELHASAAARIAVGYDSPSSRLPLPVSSF